MFARRALSLTLAFSLLVALAADAAEPVRIVCLGDSVTKAERPGVSVEETYCALLEKELRAKGLDAEVINAGVGGHTTADGLQRFAADVLARQPQHLVIMFGLNDSWIDEGRTESRVSVEEYRQNLLRMVQLSRAQQVDVVLMTPNPAIAPKYPPERNQTLKPYVETVRAIGRTERVAVLDVYTRFAELSLETADVNAYFVDAMHPNPAGQRVIADMLGAHFATMLAKRLTAD